MAIFTGTTGFDVYYGEDSDDTISGLAFADALFGGGGNDRIDGGEGNDELYGEAGADILIGGDGDDVLNETRINNGSDDSVDIMTGGGGADMFRFQLWRNGGGGNLGIIDHITDFSSVQGDILSVRLYYSYPDKKLAWVGELSNSAFSLKVGDTFGNMADSAYAGLYTWTSGSTAYLIVDVNSNGVLDATDFAIALDGAPRLSVADLDNGAGYIHQVGSAGADTWNGSVKADYYYGQGGDDIARAGSGDDELHGGGGADQLYGDEGQDLLIGDYGDDTLYGGAGDDLLYAGGRYNGEGDASDAKNVLYGGVGADRLIGSAGSDYMDGGDGDDLIAGGDTYQYADSIDTLIGGEGNDTLGGSVRDILQGGVGNDTLTGGSTQDGGMGDDQLTIAGVKTSTGGVGSDTFSLSLSAWTYGSAPDWSSYTIITDFRSAEGDRLAIRFSGSSGELLVLRGAVGAGFTLETGKVFSADSYGPGFVEAWTWTSGGDTFLIFDADSNGKLSSQDNVVKLQGVTALNLSDFTAASVGVSTGFTTKLGGSSGADVLTGSGDAEVYYALGGDDRLHGGGGADRLYGGEGADQIWGDEGDDTLYGNRGDDIIHGGDGADRIEGGAGDDTIYGDAGDDYILTGNAHLVADQDDKNAVNIVHGAAGKDTILGGASLHDQLHGDEGDDGINGNGELWGDAGNDSLGTYQGAIMHGGDGDDYLSTTFSSAAAVMYGDAGSDTFLGGSADDTLYVDLGDRQVSGGSGADTIYIADVRAGEKVVLTTVNGEYGSDTFVVTGTLSATLTLDGGTSSYGEDDLLDLSAADGVTQVDLSLATAQDVGMGRLILRGIDNVKGGDHGAILTGDDGANRLIGGAAADTLNGGKGADILTGGGGNDVLDGGAGLDTAAYEGPASAYNWTRFGDGTWTVKDVRAGATDGQDALKNIETLRFSDKTISLTQVASETLLRARNDSAVYSLEYRIANGALTLDGAIAEIVNAADATTSVASMSYQFFTGKVPTSGGVDFLISPTGPNGNNLNSAYYAQFNTVNRYINFAVNLGKNGEAKDSFAAKYGSLSLFDATKEAYKAIFGGTPTDAKVHAMIDTRVDYLAYYGGDGATGIGTKAAMVGFLLAAAATENLGVIAKSNDAWLTDLADGSAPFAVNILDPANGYYKADFVFGG